MQDCAMTQDESCEAGIASVFRRLSHFVGSDLQLT
jgi:hypothetical protein